MTRFKGALISVLNKNVSIVWMDSKYYNNEDYIKNAYTFYKKLFGDAEVIIMILDEKEHPFYYGKKEIIAELRKQVWKHFPWQEFSLDKH